MEQVRRAFSAYDDASHNKCTEAGGSMELINPSIASLLCAYLSRFGFIHRPDCTLAVMTNTETKQ